MKQFEMQEIGKDNIVSPIPDISNPGSVVIEKPILVPPVLSGMW